MRCSPEEFASDSGAKGFLVFEGINGAGKTTLINSVKEFLAEKDRDSILTKEPGGTALGDKVREILLKSPASERSSLAELFLFSASRNQLVTEILRPNMGTGKAILCDRYYYSTLAFQGYGRGLELEQLEALCSIATERVEPDAVILLDLEPNLGLERNSAGAKERDSFEEEEIAFHNRVRQGFLDLAKKSEVPFLVLDASKNADEVFAQLQPFLETYASLLSTN